MVKTEELPAGWTAAPIKEICEPPQYGYTAPAESAPVGPRMLRITDIQNGQVDWAEVPHCRCPEVEKYRLRRGDILFARTGATTGKSFLVSDVPEAVFASYLIRLRVRQRVLPEYLFWFFQSSDYWASVGGGIDDGNRPNMNGSKLANLSVSFPESVTEQRRIVARIQAVASRIHEFVDHTRSLAEAVDRTLAAFYDRVIEGAVHRPFGEVAKLARRAVKTSPGSQYGEMGIRSFGKGTFPKPAVTGAQLGNKRVYHIHAGDLVFMNVFAWEGAIAVAQAGDEGRVASHRFLTHEVAPDLARAEFLCFHFLTPQGLEDIRAASPGSAGRNRTLGVDKLAQNQVPVPAIEDQRRFVRMIRLQYELRRLQGQVELELKAFTPALLAKAIRGEL